MRKHIPILAILLLSGGTPAAQERMPDPVDGYWGPRDTFAQRWQGTTSPSPDSQKATPRLDAEGHNMDAPAPPETTGRAQPPQPKNSPDPNPRPGEEPRPIPR